MTTQLHTAVNYSLAGKKRNERDHGVSEGIVVLQRVPETRLYLSLWIHRRKRQGRWKALEQNTSSSTCQLQEAPDNSAAFI